MKNTVVIGGNRTGIAMSPKATSEMLAAVKGRGPARNGRGRGLAEVRVEYARDGEPAGSMPPPLTARGIARTALKALEGKRLTVLLDKLGERLAFERTGVRLYEALLSKLEAYGSWPGGPSRPDLARMRDQERDHFLMLKRAIDGLGADPTAVTPSADVHGLAFEGLPAALADPRTNLQQCVEVIVIAELVDNDGWANLAGLAAALGMEDLAGLAGEALRQERKHLQNVRRWVTASLLPPTDSDGNGRRRRRG